MIYHHHIPKEGTRSPNLQPFSVSLQLPSSEGKLVNAQVRSSYHSHGLANDDEGVLKKFNVEANNMGILN